MSEVDAANNSSGELKSQMSATDKSSGELESHTSSTDKCSDEETSHVSSADEPFGEKEQVNAIDKPEAQTGTTDMSGEHKPRIATTDMSGEHEPRIATTDMSGEHEPRIATTDMSGEHEPWIATTDNSSGELESHTSSTDKCSDEKTSHVSSADVPFGEKEQVNAIDEPEAQTGTTDMSGEHEPRIATADMSGELEPRIATTDMSGEHEPWISTTDNSGEQEAVIATTDMSGEQEAGIDTTDKSFVNGKPQVNATDKYSGEPQSPASPTDKSFGKENFTNKASGELESQTGTKDKPGEQMSQIGTANSSSALPSQASTADMSSSKKTQEDVTDKASGEPKSQMSTTNKYFGEKKKRVYATDKASGESAADMSTGEPEPQGGNTDKCPSKETSQESNGNQAFGDLNTYGTRHRPLTHSSADPKWPAVSSKLESRAGTSDKYFGEKPEVYAGNKASGESAADKSSGEQVSRVGTTDHSREVQSQTGIVIEETLTTRYWLMGGFIVLMIVAIAPSLPLWKGQPVVHDDTVLELFFKEVASLKKDFPGQYEGFWFRSEKILQKHLNMSHPSSPSILILTAAQDGERTLLCVSERLAKSYANSLHASWLMVDGPSKSKYDSATSKMQIDDELSSGFQSDSRAAVLYRLETLPPGSLLILYKYCDHENAAFKNVALVLTVLLDEQSLETDLSFTEVEEKVKDLLWERFANSEVGAHNEMDVDKLSGVWSRISHIVLPVLPVRSIESGSCPGI